MRSWTAVVVALVLVASLTGCGGGRFSEIAPGRSYVSDAGLTLTIPADAVAELQQPSLSEQRSVGFLELLNISDAGSLDFSVISYSEEPPGITGEIVAESDTVVVTRPNSRSIRAVIDTRLPGRNVGRVVVIAPPPGSSAPTDTLEAANVAWDVLKMQGAQLPTR